MTDRTSIPNQADSTWVIKIGSSLVTTGFGLSSSRLDALCDQVAEIRRASINVVIVSSGAIAEGSHRLGLTQRPRELPMLQAVAAVGQMGLTQAYASRFQRVGFHTWYCLRMMT